MQGNLDDPSTRTWPMVGAVLQQEWLLSSRRTRLHVFRWIYAGWLILLVFYGYIRYLEEDSRRVHAVPVAGVSTFAHFSSAPEMVGQWFAEAFVIQQMLLLVLA